METNPHRWLAALRHSHDTLSRFAGSLRPDQLDGPSYCSDWSIAQVLSHLGSGAEIFLGGLQAALSGHEPWDRAAFEATWDRWNGTPAPLQATEFVEWDERLIVALESLGRELDSLELSLFGMNLDGVGFLGLRLGEHALHSWDVRVSHDPTALVSEDAVELLIDRIPALASRMGKATEAGVEPMRLTIKTTSPSRTFLLDMEQTVTIVDALTGHHGGDAPPGVATGALVLPSESLLRLVYGRMDAKHSSETISEVGDRPWVDELRKVFPGF